MFLCLISLFALSGMTMTQSIAPNNCTLRADCALHQYLTNPKYKNCQCDDKCSLYADCCHNALKQKVYSYKKIQPSCKKIMSIDWQKPVHIVDSCPEKFKDRAVVEKCHVDLNPGQAGGSLGRGMQPAGGMKMGMQPPQSSHARAMQPPGLSQAMQPGGRSHRQLPVTTNKKPDEAPSDEYNNLLLHVPVSSVRAGLLFKNVYCAVCHGVLDLTFWSVNISQRTTFPDGVSDNASLLAEAFALAKQTRGGIRYQSTSATARPCKVSIDSCAANWRDKKTEQQCNGPKSSASFVYHRTDITIYRNVFCARCNFVNESLLSCVDPRDDLTSIPPYRPFPFSILLDINRHMGVADNPSNVVGYAYEAVEELCPEGNIYNPLTDHCESLICDYALQSNSTEAGEIRHRCGFSNGTAPENASAVASYELVWKFADAQGYLTLVVNSFSMCGLVAHLVIYTLLPSLRNTPGKCLMCLSASLLVAQFFFTFLITLSGSYPGCVFIAVTIHFFFLAYFFWMNVMAVDVFQAFNSKSFHPQSQSHPSRKFIYYNLYAWLTPAALITIALILDTTEASIKPEYAIHFCWFSNRNGLVVFFALPLLLILIADIVFFSLTVVAIKKASEGAKLATKQERSNFSLFVKLACVMGLTWISGFLAALTEAAAMWYIFIILNSSQGVFICVSFCCTRKVLRQLQDRVNKYKAKRKPSCPSTQQTELMCKLNSSPMILDKYGAKDRKATA